MGCLFIEMTLANCRVSRSGCLVKHSTSRPCLSSRWISIWISLVILIQEIRCNGSWRWGRLLWTRWSWVLASYNWNPEKKMMTIFKSTYWLLTFQAACPHQTTTQTETKGIFGLQTHLLKVYSAVGTNDRPIGRFLFAFNALCSTTWFEKCS